MNKHTIIDLLTKNYNSFINYINELSDDEFLFSYGQKWTAGQQLEHIVLCVKPLVQVFSMDRSGIEKMFGKGNGSSRTYDVLLNDYKEKLKGGGKAPDRFVPPAVLPDQKKVLSETLKKLISDLCSKIENFSEQDLDTLYIPHPLLGNLTMREMMYNAIYHVQHHQEQTIQHLKNK